MKYKVVITATGLAEVDEAYDWLAQRSPTAAAHWRAALLKAVDSLEEFPESCFSRPGVGLF